MRRLVAVFVTCFLVFSGLGFASPALAVEGQAADVFAARVIAKSSGARVIAKTGIESKKSFTNQKYRRKLGESFLSGFVIGFLSESTGGVVGTYFGGFSRPFAARGFSIDKKLTRPLEILTSQFVEKQFDQIYKRVRNTWE